MNTQKLYTVISSITISLWFLIIIGCISCKLEILIEYTVMHEHKVSINIDRGTSINIKVWGFIYANRIYYNA